MARTYQIDSMSESFLLHPSDAKELSFWTFDAFIAYAHSIVFGVYLLNGFRYTIQLLLSRQALIY